MIKKLIKSIVYKKHYKNETKKINFSKENNIFLINTPEHNNLGDQMIALASHKFLKDNFPEYNVVEITHDHFLYEYSNLKKLIPSSALIIIHGGGYLGDLWEEEQNLYYKIIESFPNFIISFPQTVYFNDKSRIHYFKEKLSNCSKLMVTLRENKSYKFMVENNILSTDKLLLTPDIVLSYPQRKYGDDKKRRGILLCLRNDKEKTGVSNKIKNILDKNEYNYDETDMIAESKILPDFRMQVIEEKLKQFSKYELIITDRLHGMIFSYLSETPCIAFDNLSNKVSGVYKWIENSNCIICNDYFDEKIFLNQLENYLKLDTKHFENCQEKFDSLINLINISL